MRFGKWAGVNDWFGDKHDKLLNSGRFCCALCGVYIGICVTFSGLTRWRAAMAMAVDTIRVAAFSLGL